MAKRRRVSPKRRSAALEFSGIVAEAVKNQRKAGKAPVVGSPLLRGLLGRSEAFQRLAASTWAEVTGGDGVVLVDGKPLAQKGGA